MQTEQKLLYILENQKGVSISGQQLAQELNVSRAAIWKAIKQLEKSGHKITAIKKKGYALQEGSDVLTVQAILPHVKQEYKHIEIIMLDSVSSTNTYAKQMAEKGAVHGSVVIANEQTQGKGRLGRKFSSPKGSGLYMSVILKENLNVQNTQSITCAAAVATCRAIKKIDSAQDVQIKWVNDLYKNGKKFCGILCEAQTDLQTGGISDIVVGIGVNVKVPNEGFDEEIKHIATAAFDKNSVVTRAHLAANILNELLYICDNLPNSAFMQEYKKLNLVPGKNIIIMQSGKEEEGIAQSITDEGHLKVITNSGEEKTLTFGEVKIILQDAKQSK